MRKWLFGFFLPLCFTLLVAGQKPPEVTPEQIASFRSTFATAKAAHDARKFEESIAGFKKCLTLVPEDPSCAYNIACGHSLRGELDPAFEWLDKAIAYGFGENNLESNQIEMVERTDPDLAAMRGDPRFAKSVATLQARAKAVEEFVNRPVFYVPAALEKAEVVAVLVLLHDMGSTPEALLKTPWKTIADELGIALVLPSAPQPVAHVPEKGMTWFFNLPSYLEHSAKLERSVGASLESFRKDHKIDKDRLFIAGEGQGGIVAFNVAIGSPAHYKGVVVFDAPALFQLANPRAANAAKVGFRGKLFENEAGIFGIPAGTDIATVVDEVGKAFVALKLDKVSVVSYALDPANPELRKQLALEALREYMAAPKPVESGTLK